MESIKVVHHAIKSGVNYIDVAPWYGHGKAETVLGKVTSFLYNTIQIQISIGSRLTLPKLHIYSQNFQSEIPETFCFKWKLMELFFPICSKLMQSHQ